MFNSISNNFGAGTIQFKDVQESNYIVLNAKFTCNPQDEAYKAAEVLEISVPKLSINRSTESGVVVRFIDRQIVYDEPKTYDAGTFAKSWVKDANTLCIEKLSIFDEQTELIIYIQALYCQLGQGNNATMGTKKTITCLTDTDYLQIGSSSSFCVIHKKWAFYHLDYDRVSYSMEDKDWEALFENFPTDIKADVPIISNGNNEHKMLGGVTESHIEDGYFSLPVAERGREFYNMVNAVFSFAYLVRDYDASPEVQGRLHYQAESISASAYSMLKDVNMELTPMPSAVSLTCTMYNWGSGPVSFSTADFPEVIPEFAAFFLTKSTQNNGLEIQMLEIQVTKTNDKTNIKVIGQSGDKYLTSKIFDTTIPMTI